MNVCLRLRVCASRQHAVYLSQLKVSLFSSLTSGVLSVSLRYGNVGEAGAAFLQLPDGNYSNGIFDVSTAGIAAMAAGAAFASIHTAALPAGNSMLRNHAFIHYTLYVLIHR
jgi:hypothetical protein